MKGYHHYKYRQEVVCTPDLFYRFRNSSHNNKGVLPLGVYYTLIVQYTVYFLHQYILISSKTNTSYVARSDICLWKLK